MVKNKEYKQKAKPIETEIGMLYGRDAIFMDSSTFDGHNLMVKGEFSINSASKYRSSLAHCL